MRSIREFFDLGGEQFEIWREDEVKFELTGIRDRKKREIQFEPDAGVKEGDIAMALNSGERFFVTEVDTQAGHGGNPFALIASYQTETSRRSASQQPSTQSFVFHAPAYGIFGSQQSFQFEQVIRDLDRQIEEHGGEDKEELQEMAAEIRETLEQQDSIPRSKFERWSELANKHIPWLLGPLGTLLLSYVFGTPGGSE